MAQVSDLFLVLLGITEQLVGVIMVASIINDDQFKILKIANSVL
jgi:hypothetical protein